MDQLQVIYNNLSEYPSSIEENLLEYDVHKLYNILSKQEEKKILPDDKLRKKALKISVEYGNLASIINDNSESMEDLMKVMVRLDDIRVQFDFPEGENNQRIPSLLLVHFVENAFKHGILDDDMKAVTIHLETKDNRLIFNM